MSLQTKKVMIQYPMFRQGEDCVGFFVISKCGHDSGQVYVIVSAAGNFVHVANGKNKIIAKPKKKNPAHLFITKEKVTEEGKLTDLRLARLIKEFNVKRR